MKRACLILLAILMNFTSARSQVPEPALIVSQWECGWQTYLLVNPPERLDTTEGLIVWYLNGNPDHPYGQDLYYRGRLPGAEISEVEVWTSHIGPDHMGELEVIYLQAGGYSLENLPHNFELTCEQENPPQPVLYLPLVVH